MASDMRGGREGVGYPDGIGRFSQGRVHFLFYTRLFACTDELAAGEILNLR